MSSQSATGTGKRFGVSFKTLSRSFRHRDYRLFFIGQFVSLTGTWMQQVAQSWLVYRLTGSGLALGLVAFCGQIPVFALSLLGGVIADRFNRRTVLLFTQAVAMVQAAALALLTFAGHIQVWEVAVLAGMLGTVNAVDIPTRQSFIVELVGKEDLHNAIALNSSMFNLARIAGPSLAGLLVAALGEGWCFSINAASFLAVIVCLARMGVPRAKAQPKASLAEHLREGLVYAWCTREVRTILLCVAATSLMGMSYLVLMPIFADKILGRGAGGLGLLMATGGLGSLAGALMLAMRGESRGIGRIAYAALLGFGVFLTVFGQSRSYALSLALMLPLGFCMIASMAAANTMLQTLCPDRLRGRVMALFSMMFVGMAPFGALIAGFLEHLIGAGATVSACGAACLALMFLAGRTLLHL